MYVFTIHSEGYTSISVREPLANIRQQRPHDSHYATVSDDSGMFMLIFLHPSSYKHKFCSMLVLMYFFFIS